MRHLNLTDELAILVTWLYALNCKLPVESVLHPTRFTSNFWSLARNGRIAATAMQLCVAATDWTTIEMK